MNNAITSAVLALSAIAWTAAQAMTGGSVEAKFRGDWVPAKAACNSPLRMVIDANLVAFVNGGQRQEFRKLEQCFSCEAGGMTTKPQSVWLSTDAMGDSPWTVTMDGTKSKVAVSVALDKQLAARFPLGTAALKKCP